jgi:hypothetical protein
MSGKQTEELHPGVPGGPRDSHPHWHGITIHPDERIYSIETAYSNDFIDL